MPSDPTLAITNLRCEYKTNPIGIDARLPRLSWELDSPQRGAVQSAYQVRVAESAEALPAGGPLLWDSGRVASDETAHVPYSGPELRSGQRCYWQVRAWDGAGQPSAWSEPAFWEMGLLSPADWQAAWIEPGLPEDIATSGPAPMLRSVFTMDGSVTSARAYITALGLYEAEINGRRVGDQRFTPGWTAYQKRVQYQTYDVTELLRPGANAIGITLGDGWYRGYIGFQGQRNFYGDHLALLVQIRIVYADPQGGAGRVQWVCSGEGWRAATGPIRMSDLYNGESYDARLERPGWSEPGYDDGDWAPVQVVERSKEILVAPVGPAVRAVAEIKPVEIIHTPAGETVFDLGQNMTGNVRLRVTGPAGTAITLRHAEVLDKAGNLYTTNLRSAKQTVTYTLKGDGEEIYEPHFSFQGFRYVAVEGWPASEPARSGRFGADADAMTRPLPTEQAPEPPLDALVGVVVSSDTPPTGEFECSDPLINQLQHNIVWGQRGNFLDVPTDCPQRDERLGWTGDAQVFARTACFNMDVAGFFTKWLRDLAADQKENGSVPFVVPDVLSRGGMGGAGSSAWGDAATIVPWTLYLCYGDRGLLAEQYPSMRGWVDFIAGQAGKVYLWRSGFHFGDWLAIASPMALTPEPVTNVDLISTAFFAYSTGLVARAARVLGRDGDVWRYEALWTRIADAFCREYVTPGGRVGPDTQTAYVLALMFDLLPEEQRPEAARRLAEDIRRRGNHISTGFVGTSYLCHVLTRFGYTDVAYALLNQEDYPSWLYAVKLGATTIWERWDGIKPDGEFQDASMNSFNHYAYGAVGDWLYRTAAGIDVDPEAPGYEHILIRPQPGGKLSWARAALHSIRGPIESAWHLEKGQMRLEVAVPANARATVRLPGAALAGTTEGGLPVAQLPGVRAARQDGADVVVEIGSGRYEFTYPAVAATRPGSAARFTVDSKVGELLADERARAVLERHFPELIGSPIAGMATNMTLAQAALFAPQLISAAALEAVARDLERLG
jgi:alpha-L-rhamnosidase